MPSRCKVEVLGRVQGTVSLLSRVQLPRHQLLLLRYPWVVFPLQNPTTESVSVREGLSRWCRPFCESEASSYRFIGIYDRSLSFIFRMDKHMDINSSLQIRQPRKFGGTHRFRKYPHHEIRLWEISREQQRRAFSNNGQIRVNSTTHMATNITFHSGPYSIWYLSSILICLSQGSVTSSERAQLLRQKGVTIWLTGLSASGKVRTDDIL